MFEIIETRYTDGLDYIIKNKNLIIFLYNMDWNGKIYCKGYYHDGGERKGYSYKPIYKQTSEGAFELVGFEAI